MQSNSLETYKWLKQEGILGDRQNEVFQLILNNPNKTDRELLELSDQEDSNYIRPRRRELVRLGIIETSGDRLCSVTHRKSALWRKRSFSRELIIQNKQSLQNQSKEHNLKDKIHQKEQELARIQGELLDYKNKLIKQKTLFNFNTR